MGNYNVLDEIKAIASQYELRRPDSIADVDWLLVTPETKNLLIQIEDLKKSLKGAYWEAVRQRDWERALLAYQILVGSPYLLSLNREIYEESECEERENKFIATAKDWVCDATELLG